MIFLEKEKKILILGAGQFMIPAIKIAKEMGLTVVVSDRNENAEGFYYSDYHATVDITDIEGTLNVAKKYNIDGILPLNDFGVKTAAVIADELSLTGISPDTANLCTDKRLMRKTWEKSGVPCPKFKIVKNYSEAKKTADEIGFPVITKPPDTMGGSRGVVKINNSKELKEAFEFATSFTKQDSILLEEYVFGDECSVESVVYNSDIHVIAISDKTKLPPPYRVDKSVTYPTKHSQKMQNEIKNVTKDAISSLGITNGATHLELSVTDKGIRLFEIGARTGGGGIIAGIQVPIVYGVNMMRETIRIALGEPPEIIFSEKLRGSDFRFLTPKPGTLKRISGVKKALSLENVVTGACFVKPGDIVREVRSGNDRSGYVVTRGESRDQAVSIADKVEGLIRYEYE